MLILLFILVEKVSDSNKSPTNVRQIQIFLMLLFNTKQRWSSIWDLRFTQLSIPCGKFLNCLQCEMLYQKVKETNLRNCHFGGGMIFRSHLFFIFSYKIFWNWFEIVTSRFHCTRDWIFDLTIRWFILFHFPLFWLYCYFCHTFFAGLIQVLSHFIVAIGTVMHMCWKLYRIKALQPEFSNVYITFSINSSMCIIRLEIFLIRLANGSLVETAMQCYVGNDNEDDDMLKIGFMIISGAKQIAGDKISHSSVWNEMRMEYAKWAKFKAKLNQFSLLCLFQLNWKEFVVFAIVLIWRSNRWKDKKKWSVDQL